MISLLEEFVCYLYGYHQKDVNVVRFRIHSKKLRQENKVVDLATLPPCKSVLKLHILRANAVAKIWKCTDAPIINVPDLKDHGWNSDGEIQWLDDAFPDDINEMLFDPAFIDEMEFGSEDESNDEGV